MPATRRAESGEATSSPPSRSFGIGHACTGLIGGASAVGVISALALATWSPISAAIVIRTGISAQASGSIWIETGLSGSAPASTDAGSSSISTLK